METTERILKIYRAANGSFPFQDWLHGLKDKRTKARIFQRIDRIRLGNFGDCRSVGLGVQELRIFWGAGYRVYYALWGTQIVLLLCGGDKNSQRKDILLAQRFWKEFQNETRRLR